VPRRITPLIAVPSIAGTASEISRYAVLTKDRSKVSVRSVHIIPDVAAVDPTLTITMPPQITTSIGINALAHTIEGVISLDTNLFSDTIAVQSIKLILKYLRRVYYKGTNLEASTSCQ